MSDLSAVLLVVVMLALVCLTAIVLTACLRRRGVVRGWLRAGSVDFGIEIDAGPPDDPGRRPSS